ncbi:smoothened homolog [Uloborus diversus]|uniref:smoothened homolog n=1 Tax=Uloborus diversus TaxID=327109 RepID=UPI00240A0748|nr:smoothened homolog [Uloborus diversus]
MEAVCQPLHNATCFGTSLPYAYTSVALAEDSVSHFDVQDNLALWQGLKSVPRCWAVVQPLLCAVYMPKCENGSVYLPSQEMCNITRGPCKSVEIKHSWPSFLRCGDKKLFPPRCRNPLQEVKFNTSYKCMLPLLETSQPSNWYHEVEGCGIQCQNPFFTAEEHNSIHHLISLIAPICLALNVLSVATFCISWKAANKYPSVIIFYINLCITFATLGWLIQFYPGAREKIVCLPDGTIRLHEPSSFSWCTITFFLTYYWLMAAIVWCVILTLAWHYVFRQSGAPKEYLEKKAGIAHIIAWSIPVVLTVCIIASTGVQGDSISGICFVGYSNSNMRIIFLLVPVGLAALIGLVCLCSVLYTLIKLKMNGSKAQVKRIQPIIIKIGIFTVFMVLFIVGTFVFHLYEFFNQKEWDDSLREYIVCLAMNSAQTLSIMGESASMKCELKSRPNIVWIRLHMMCFFGFGGLMTVFVWTKQSYEYWKQFRNRLCAPAEKTTFKVKRHQIVAKAYNTRREAFNQGHLSFSLNSTHEDPIGMNLDVNSVTSRDISSSWAAALPHFIMRRNAITDFSSFVPMHCSSVSDISRHISVDSFNQPTLDSLSMQMSEQEYAHALRHPRRKTRKERERFLHANRIAPWFPGSRRGSDTSLHSSMMSAARGAKVTKATSTGDLGADVMLAGSVLPPMLMRGAPYRNTIPREPVNPPFTHGMTDNSHRLGNQNPSSALGSNNISRRLTPNSAIPNPLIGMPRPPIYPQNYNFMNSMPFGYLSGGVYPSFNNMFPGYPAPQFMYHSYNSMPYTPFGDFQNTDPLLSQYQDPLLPMEPRDDSASETPFFPIIMSESEYTDTGFRSYDESHMFPTQRIIPEQVTNNPVQSEVHQPKSGLEPQECAKTQFLKRMGSFNSKPLTAKSPHPPSGKNSPPHSEVPPPSPAQSTKSLNEDELDDVFEEDSQNDNNVSTVSAPQTSETETLLGKLKSKFKRATSRNSQVQEMLELADKPCGLSVEQVPSVDMKNRPASRRNTPNEKLLQSSEGTSLIATNETGENVSR